LYTPTSYHLGILKLLEGISFQSFKVTILSSNLDLARRSKGVSDLKTCLDYYKDLARNSENLNFHLPVVTKLFYWLRSQCSQPKLFILFAWFGMLFRKNGKEILNIRNLLPDLHNNLSTFYKHLWMLEEKKDS